MGGEHDDPFGAEPGRGEHGAQSDRAVTDNQHAAAGLDTSRHRRVLTGSHHIGERE